MRERVVIEKRKGFTPKQRETVLLASNSTCPICRHFIFAGQAWDVEHRVPLAIGGTNEPDNLEPVHSRPCHAIKTAADLKAIAKAKRIEARANGTRRERKPIPSRGFGDLSRKFSGSISPTRKASRNIEREQ